jgi:hypothetical protein
MANGSFTSWLNAGPRFILALGVTVGLCVCVFGQPSTARAAVGINQQINYQGKLMDASGSVVADGTYQMALSLYNSSSFGAVPFWTASGTNPAHTKIPVTVSNGLFTVMLGDTSSDGGRQNPLSSLDWNNDTIYLGITIGSDDEMTPRKRIGAVPQAFNAAQLQGMSASGTALSGHTLFTIYQTDASLPAAPRSALDVRTEGASVLKDYIARFYYASTTEKFAIRNDGYVTAVKLAAQTSTTGATISGMNFGEKVLGNTWGGAFNRLLVGSISPDSATGTLDMASVFRYEGSHENGICIDNSDTNAKCRFRAGSSLISEGTINASDFDLAEQYHVTGGATPGDLLVADPENPLFVRRSSGALTGERLVGIASTKPGLLLGDLSDGVDVALAGRVPTRVSAVNGAIAIGDALTASPFEGVAMKATAPGQIVGYALEPATATGTIEVFVKVGYDAGSFLRAEGKGALAEGTIILNSTNTATADAQTADSWGITLRGSVWDGLQALKKDFTLFNQSATDGHSAFSLKMGTSTLWSVDERGSMRTAGDLFLGGRFFPATRSGQQSDKYIFLDDTGPASSTYIATNADGWQANTSYDFAERYASSEALEPGDVVILSQQGQVQVERSKKAGDVPVGIVSTRPGFVAGAPVAGTFPIALAGRVPTRVAALTGQINVGDPLAPSNVPGVAVKAIQAGPIVGYALESYSSANIGKIEVYVSAGWWGGSAIVMNESKLEKVGLTTPVIATTTASTPKSYQGVARILAGATKVKVTHPTLGTFPLIQVTPYGKVDTQWWTDNSSDHGFEILLKEPLTQDVTFSWRAEEMLPADDRLFLSNDQTVRWDIHTGQPIIPSVQTQPQTQVETLPEVTSATTTPTVSTTSSEVVGTSSTTAEAPVEVIPTPVPDTTSSDPVTPPEAIPPAPVPTPEPTPTPDAVVSVPERVVVPDVVPVVVPEPAPAPTPAAEPAT